MYLQGDPIEWVSDHRYHHVHTDTPLDPHSPYDGYFWSHIGWLWDNEVLMGQKMHQKLDQQVLVLYCSMQVLPG